MLVIYQESLHDARLTKYKIWNFCLLFFYLNNTRKD